MRPPAIPAFRSPLWLPEGHAQTIIPTLLDRRAAPPLRRERWDTPDGDFIDVDFLDIAPQRTSTPMLVLFHGLEGSAHSRYARLIARQAQAQGWRLAIVHFRGCSGSLNRLPRFYHSGDSAEVDWILRRVHTQAAPGALHAVGVSLGGNALLKWLGEQGSASQTLLVGAVAISAPVDLHASGHSLARGFNRIYTRMFLATLKKKSLHKLAQYPGLFDPEALHAARNLYEFDNIVTAPLHGFRDCNDYWTRASSRPLLGAIRTPTLMLNARNDPFLPATALPAAREMSTAVMPDFPASGGHVGFWAMPDAGGADWLPRRVFAFLDALTPTTSRATAASASRLSPPNPGDAHG